MKIKSIWKTPDNLSFKLGHETHVWRLTLEMNPAQLNNAKLFLNKEELSRVRRFYFDKHRNHYIAAHGQMRKILCYYLNVKNEDLNFSFNEFGKPFLENGALYFNISHSNNLALLAINLKFELGVDIEWKKRKVNHLQIGERFFSAKEFSDLKSLPPEHQRQGFFNCWTRKEAYIKARGKGLGIPLKEFEVSLKPDESVELRSTNHDPEAVSSWHLYSVNPHPDYTGALCVNHTQEKILFWNGYDTM